MGGETAPIACTQHSGAEHITRGARRWVFRVQGSGSRVQGLGLGVRGSGCRVQGRVQGARRVWGSGVRITRGWTGRGAGQRGLLAYAFQVPAFREKVLY